MVTVITHQVERRVGALDTASRERISMLSSGQLECLGDALLDFTKVEDLTNWLEAE